MQKSEEQAAEMREQTEQLADEVATLRKGLETKMQKDFQEAFKELLEVIMILQYTTEVGATSRPHLVTHEDVAPVYWMGTA